MSVVDWLLDADPAVRWQVLRDLVGAPSEEVGAERSRVAREGWGAALLALQAEDGRWDGGSYRPGWADEEKPFFDAWTATHFALVLLRVLGIDATAPEAVRAVSRVRDGVRWETNGAPYFDGEVEPCINGLALANGAYLGVPTDAIVERVLADQLADGGWNCWAAYGASAGSFHSTICVLEGLRAWELAGGADAAVASARQRGEEYLLDRHLFRRRTTGEIVDPRFTMFSFPAWWYYDVLRGLDYLRSARIEPDDRCAEAIALVERKRGEDGRWALENVHQGATHLELEGPEGSPSRWNTLRALRVLRWAGRLEAEPGLARGR